MDAVALERSVVARGALRLRVAAQDLPPGGRVAVSIRPHHIVLVPVRETSRLPGRHGDNILTGTIERASFLGDSADYRVHVDGSDLVLRVAAPPSLRLPPGDPVSLAVAPESCLALPPDEE